MPPGFWKRSAAALSVPVLDASEFAFADTQDFIMGGILNPQWNHWLFSAC
ncbi:MAG: hypothetical protein ACLSAH_16225 [Bilophila wadsworthia]